MFISAGEASGDSYGAMLVDALRSRRPNAEFFGCAGPRLQASGCQPIVDAGTITMVGLVEVIPGLPRAWCALRDLKRAIRERRPQLAILIDFPDFNLRLAHELKKYGVPVLYFVAPQVWAWRKGRLKDIRRDVDRLMCLFPFEEEFFRKAGVNAEFVGHPLASRARPSQHPEEFRQKLGIAADQAIVALLPGSRRKEVQLNLPPMLDAVRLLAAQRPCAFVLPAATTLPENWLRNQLGSMSGQVRIVENLFYDAVGHAQAAIVASGTASTETAILGTPMAIVYRVSGLSWWLGRRLVKVPFFSIVNLVAGREVIREFIQDQFAGPAVAAEITRILDDPSARAKMQADLKEVTRRLRRSSPGSGIESGIEADSMVVDVAVGGQEIDDPIQRAAAVAESMLLRPVADGMPGRD